MNYWIRKTLLIFRTKMRMEYLAKINPYIETKSKLILETKIHYYNSLFYWIKLDQQYFDYPTFFIKDLGFKLLNKQVVIK